MKYLPNLLAGSANDQSALVLDAKVVPIKLRNSTRYMVYVDVELIQHPNRKRIYRCAYYGALEFTLGQDTYRSVGDHTPAIASALGLSSEENTSILVPVTGNTRSLNEVENAIRMRLTNSLVSVYTVGGVWFAK